MAENPISPDQHRADLAELRSELKEEIAGLRATGKPARLPAPETHPVSPAIDRRNSCLNLENAIRVCYEFAIMFKIT
ncbi:MAG TPA: hypothetical protein VIG57_10335 [Candidatus Entotheonella sp.]|jgi:hypothetical protein